MCIIVLSSQFLMPGLVDSHIHAPLYKFTDTDHDMPLLDWLRTHTFPTEAMFSDIEVARNVYPRVVVSILFISVLCLYNYMH